MRTKVAQNSTVAGLIQTTPVQFDLDFLLPRRRAGSEPGA
jgi:hypothetical protein